MATQVISVEGEGLGVDIFLRPRGAGGIRRAEHAGAEDPARRLGAREGRVHIAVPAQRGGEE